MLAAAMIVAGRAPGVRCGGRPALSPFPAISATRSGRWSIFVIVVVVLGKFAWGPVLGLLQQREDFIHRSLSDAKHDRDEAEARLKEYTAKLQSAHAEAARLGRRRAQRFGAAARGTASAGQGGSRRDPQERRAPDRDADREGAAADPRAKRWICRSRLRRSSSSATSRRKTTTS